MLGGRQRWTTAYATVAACSWSRNEGRDSLLSYVTEQQGQGSGSRCPNQARLDIDAVLKPGKTGQFDLMANGQPIASRSGNWFTRHPGVQVPDASRGSGASCAQPLVTRHQRLPFCWSSWRRMPDWPKAPSFNRSRRVRRSFSVVPVTIRLYAPPLQPELPKSRTAMVQRPV